MTDNKANTKDNSPVQEDRRKNNPQDDAVALAKGLHRRREDKINNRFYFGMVALLMSVLMIFFIGSFFVN